MTIKKYGIKLIWIFLIGMLLLPMGTSTAYAKETDEKKTVRIGYFLYEGYQEGEEGEPKSGSAYVYAQKIRYYTGWEYEYVYGEISELFTMLEKGEIDMMSYITYSEERAEKYLFSEEPQGSETYYIYTHVDNSEISTDYNTLNGKTIGVTAGTFQEKYFADWCEKNNITCNIISYPYNMDLHDALSNKELDAIVDIRVTEDEGHLKPWKSIMRIGTQPLYFAVSKYRPDLLEELNYAHAQLIASDEFYGYNLVKQFQSGANSHNIYLSAKQKEYIKNKGVLKVGYLGSTNPIAFTNTETGEMEGLAAEYLAAMEETYGMQFETTEYSSESELLTDLNNRKIDIILPVGWGYWTAEEWDISLTTPIAAIPMSVVYKTSGELKTIQKPAVIEGSMTQVGYVETHYPDAEIYYVKNTKEALNALKKGLADCYFVRSNSLSLLNQIYDIEEQFHTMALVNSMDLQMAVRTEDSTLTLILDKGITLIPESQENTANYRYAYAQGKISLWQAVKANWQSVIALCVLIILVLTMIYVLWRYKTNVAYTGNLQKEKALAEAALEKAQKAQLAKSDFLSQMSHDIRTPMNAIIGFTNMMKDTDDIEVIKTQYSPKIDTASHHLLMHINDVLEMNRIESGKLVFNRAVFDLEKIFESVITVMRMQAEEKKLELLLSVDIRDHYVYVDENHVNRILLNLISNAIKFTEPGGRITVSIRQVSDEEQGYADYKMQVSDTGVGMSPEFVKKLFQPFERENSAMTKKQQGTGLGMTIVKRIIDAAGDGISVDTEPGKGTTFTIDAKYQLGSKSEAHKGSAFSEKTLSVEEVQEKLKGKRILLVEDNEFNCMIAQAILENAGFVVETAEDGYIAVNKVIQVPAPDYYDMILMDIQMPVMDGYEATRAIRALADARAQVKIIAVTANAFESDREKALESGMNAHVPKPLDVDVLYQTLLEIMG